jgi:putative ABC transport system permease protein
MKYFLFLTNNAFSDLKRNKVRTFLTSLGIMIGVLSVVLLIGFGLGLKNFIKKQFESLGTNVVYIYPGRLLGENGQINNSEGFGGGVEFSFKDLQKLSKIQDAEYVVPIFIRSTIVSARNESKFTDVYASTTDIFLSRNLEAEYGRLFKKSDELKRAKKAVVGPDTAIDLFGDAESAIGKTIEFESQRYEIIGVLEAKGGGFGGPSFDSFVYIPFESSYSFNTEKSIQSFLLSARSEEDIPQLKADIEKIMLRSYEKDDFSVVEQTEILNIVSSIFQILNTILVAIGSISLIVGGIGIMNIMYASVTERIKEIGIRRAIGATKKDILLQFLTQSVMLSLFGGILGLVFSILIILIIQPFFPAALNLVSIVAALGISSGIGIFFGVFPAKKAADLSPIEAIRYE